MYVVYDSHVFIFFVRLESLQEGLFFWSTCNNTIVMGTYHDCADNHVYRYINIGNMIGHGSMYDVELWSPVDIDGFETFK